MEIIIVKGIKDHTTKFRKRLYEYQKKHGTNGD